ncbi:hypothetical protein BDP27DRAFT_1446354 [Rhodocollybia butyracea]|uniref:Uncharacterized protein n=1 Tax=Rhodocollybia butyracea TaxID=206335 RepID=A0A9P5Q056_9AGAR|nr:hypothetical protein BDP27DRAFT_1446354 [Rhodocollybia butyracea]
MIIEHKNALGPTQNFNPSSFLYYELFGGKLCGPRRKRYGYVLENQNKMFSSLIAAESDTLLVGEVHIPLPWEEGDSNVDSNVLRREYFTFLTVFLPVKAWMGHQKSNPRRDRLSNVVQKALDHITNRTTFASLMIIGALGRIE